MTWILIVFMLHTKGADSVTLVYDGVDCISQAHSIMIVDRRVRAAYCLPWSGTSA